VGALKGQAAPVAYSPLHSLLGSLSISVVYQRAVTASIITMDLVRPRPGLS